MGRVANFKGIGNMKTRRVPIQTSAAARYNCIANEESIITSRDSLLHHLEVVQRLLLSLNPKETLHSFVLRMEQGTQRHCTAITRL